MKKKKKKKKKKKTYNENGDNILPKFLAYLASFLFQMCNTEKEKILSFEIIWKKTENNLERNNQQNMYD